MNPETAGNGPDKQTFSGADLAKELITDVPKPTEAPPAPGPRFVEQPPASAETPAALPTFESGMNVHVPRSSGEVSTDWKVMGASEHGHINVIGPDGSTKEVSAGQLAAAQPKFEAGSNIELGGKAWTVVDQGSNGKVTLFEAGKDIDEAVKRQTFSAADLQATLNSEAAAKAKALAEQSGATKGGLFGRFRGRS